MSLLMSLLPDTRAGYWITCYLILMVAMFFLTGITFIVGEDSDFAYNVMRTIASTIPSGFVTIFEDGSWLIDHAPSINGCFPGMPCN